jgi:microcystin-dependent protein
MTTPYVGEIRLLAFPRIPTGWLACDGSLKSISQYEILYTLLGTTYGGDGVQTFGVPDLRGQIPVHQGTGVGLTPRVLGQATGSENVTLTLSEIPQHTHNFLATTNPGTTTSPGPTLTTGAITGDHLYLNNPTAPLTKIALAPAFVVSAGNNVSHENLMPTLTLSICIAWLGIFPSQN